MLKQLIEQQNKDLEFLIGIKESNINFINQTFTDDEVKLVKFFNENKS